MAYDPDADPDDLDPGDHDAVDAFLNDPGNIKMWEQLGAAFRDSPPGEQIPVLLDELRAFEKRRDELVALIDAETSPHDDPRRQMLDAIDSYRYMLTARIAELTGPSADTL